MGEWDRAKNAQTRSKTKAQFEKRNRNWKGVFVSEMILLRRKCIRREARERLKKIFHGVAPDDNLFCFCSQHHLHSNFKLLGSLSFSPFFVLISNTAVRICAFRYLFFLWKMECWRNWTWYWRHTFFSFVSMCILVCVFFLFPCKWMAWDFLVFK